MHRQSLDLVEEIRHLLPESVHRADELLADRETVVRDGLREAERIINRARSDADRMVSEHEVYLAAVAEAQAMRNDVADETDRMRRETDDYIDAKLAAFEITLERTLKIVARGRDRLNNAMYQELAPEQGLVDELYDEGR